MKIVMIFLNLFVNVHCLIAANVIGYFTNWGIYGDQPYTAMDVPYKYLTHIQYAFFKPEINGDISSFDTYADEKILLGEMVLKPVQYRDSTKSLIYLAHKNHVKVLASIGGWTGSSNFPSMAAAAVSRSKFCSKAIELIKQYDFDGIDIDWEYPCFAQHNGTPDDASNFVSLLKELRDSLGAMPGEKKLITLAIAGESSHGKNFLVEQFYKYVDFISIMTYNYTGAWGDYAWHSSPLYDYGAEDNWALNRAMQYYKERGIPSSKLNIGLAFYGKTFSGCLGPNKPFSGPGEDSGSLDYSVISSKIQNGVYTRYWDDDAMVPYCLSSENEYCSYDDTVSIRLKGQYCIDNGFAGAIIWELKCGRLTDGSQPLLYAAAGVLMAETANRKKAFQITENLKTIQVRNCSYGPIIRLANRKSTEVCLGLYEISGKTIFEIIRRYDAGNREVKFPETEMLHCGNYILKINNGIEKYSGLLNIIR